MSYRIAKNNQLIIVIVITNVDIQYANSDGFW